MLELMIGKHHKMFLKATIWRYDVAMGGISATGRQELALVLGGRRFVTPADVATELRIDSTAATQRLARWARDGWVRRVRRGLYIGVPVEASNPRAWSFDALVIAARVWDPCYFTGWTAARHWALTEQVFRTTVLKTSARVRETRASLLDNDYVVAHTDPAALSWGLVSEWNDGERLRFADAARTVVEILDDPRLGGGMRHSSEIFASFLDEHDPGLLIAAADRLDNGAVFKRLGYLAEHLDLDDSAFVLACRERLTAGVSALDPTGPPGGHRNPRWGLRVNAAISRDGAS